ncbi:MAG: citrate synthase [Thermoanaerobaculia bacterium]|nr:MAG: citrate synthase [Thermoanaerobaculia bacterium]MBZ0102082.1 citrate synthase [Thermoanaerobaculia bacterium]
MGNAKLILEGKEYEFPLVVGTENEVGIDISKLRDRTGVITLDDGYGNTGSCRSAITFIDGDKGILRYRGIPIEELEQARFTEVAFLLIYGHLPNAAELTQWREKLTRHSLLHEDMKKFFEGFPASAHPMAMLSAMVASLSTYYPDDLDVDLNIVRLLAKAKTIAGFSYKKSIGQPFMYPMNHLAYTENFLHMMFAVPAEPLKISPTLERALNLLLILHADHEQNCSTSTVRMVGSSGANLFASISAGISALWGPLHGGANQAVIEMLEKIQADGGGYQKFVDKAKDKESGFRLMGFGHRVYKNFDPRSRILKKAADAVLAELGVDDPLLEIAKGLEEVALKDPYFVERKLYPNVDFYSGILYRAMGIPTNMFTVMFALGRLPGWIAHWKEMREQGSRINRPRQIYTGATQSPWVPVDKR